MDPDAIRAARQRLDLTAGQAARLVGVDGRTWRRYEDGSRVMPPPIARLLALLRLPVVRASLTRMAAETQR